MCLMGLHWFEYISYSCLLVKEWGLAVVWWLRPCATNWKASGLRLDEVNELHQFT